jgi:hydrogenase maturation factor
VDTELVGPVRPGDRVLVHAGVALTRLDGRSGGAA